MFKKEFTLEYEHMAHTLEPSYIGTNDSGWVIKGRIHEDGFEWVNEFEAEHTEYGIVWGDFEVIVYADSKEGYEHFVENHPPLKWDYYDI